MTKYIFSIFLALVLGVGVFWFSQNKEQVQEISDAVTEKITETVLSSEIKGLSIEELRKKEFPGSDIVIEQDLGDKGAYHSYVVSYLSEGLKLRALMNVPDTGRSTEGFPVLVLNHGFIPPDQYSTINSYPTYSSFFARNGYIMIKPDYRGHDQSEGESVMAHTSAAYTTDVLNLLSSIKKYKDANPNKIAMWGHSMGGGVTLRAMVISKDIKAGVFWAGVVASPQTMLDYGLKRAEDPATPGYIKEAAKRLADMFGDSKILDLISPYGYLDFIDAPISIHHGTVDKDVPLQFSDELNAALKAQDKQVEYFVYQNGDHNFTNATHRDQFLQRTLDFLNRSLNK